MIDRIMELEHLEYISSGGKTGGQRFFSIDHCLDEKWTEHTNYDTQFLVKKIELYV